MSSLTHVEPEAISEIQALIKDLPSPEELTKLNNPRDLKKVRTQVGQIMQMMEAYGVKNFEYQARFKSVKNLPPRYKVHDWKKASVQSIVKVSEIIDNKGYGNLSERILKVISSKNFNEISDELYRLGFIEESKIVKAANGEVEGSDANSTEIVNSFKNGFGNNYLKVINDVRGGIETLSNMAKQIKQGAKSDSMIKIADNLFNTTDAMLREWTNFIGVSKDFTESTEQAVSQMQSTSKNKKQYRYAQLAILPPVVQKNGQLFFGGQPVMNNPEVLGQIRNLLVKDLWATNDSSRIMGIVTNIVKQFQTIRDNISKEALLAKDSKSTILQNLLLKQESKMEDMKNNLNQFSIDVKKECDNADALVDYKNKLDTTLRSLGMSEVLG
ncbi:MAG: hypothetical protein WCO84_09010, partial [bacterium]